jgi:hypothetical protein
VRSAVVTVGALPHQTRHDIIAEVVLDERAGKPADPSSLVDVDALIAAYYERRPDPSDPAQRVAFGTSGHRGSSFRNAFN